MEINYRPLDISNDTEVEIVARIHESAPAYWIPGYQSSSDQIERRIDQLKRQNNGIGRFFQIAEALNSEIVGFHWIDLEKSDDIFFGHIKSLWVRDDYQHRGIASQLKKNGEAWAAAKGAIYLKTTVHSNNIRMINFNEHRGYEKGFVEMSKKLL